MDNLVDEGFVQNHQSPQPLDKHSIQDELLSLESFFYFK